MTAFPLCLYMVEIKSSGYASLYEGTSPIKAGPTLMTSFNIFFYLLKALSLNTVTLGVRVSTYGF